MGYVVAFFGILLFEATNSIIRETPETDAFAIGRVPRGDSCFMERRKRNGERQFICFCVFLLSSKSAWLLRVHGRFACKLGTDPVGLAFPWYEYAYNGRTTEERRIV